MSFKNELFFDNSMKLRCVTGVLSKSHYKIKYFAFALPSNHVLNNTHRVKCLLEELKIAKVSIQYKRYPNLKTREANMKTSGPREVQN